MKEDKDKPYFTGKSVYVGLRIYDKFNRCKDMWKKYKLKNK